jgi:hypothetical protein
MTTAGTSYSRLRLDQGGRWHKAIEYLSHRGVDFTELKTKTNYNTQDKQRYKEFETAQGAHCT